MLYHLTRLVFHYEESPNKRCPVLPRFIGDSVIILECEVLVSKEKENRNMMKEKSTSHIVSSQQISRNSLFIKCWLISSFGHLRFQDSYFCSIINECPNDIKDMTSYSVINRKRNVRERDVTVRI
jgi:hypothetical protein